MKYKQFILGIIVGALLFSIAPISASIEQFICYKADYRLVINGVEFNDPDLPLMNYKGYTIGSVRKILEAVGIPITWNAELNQAEVTSNPTGAQNNNVEEDTMSIEYDPITGLPVGAEVIEYKRWKNAVRYNDNIYLSNTTLAGAGIFVRADVNANTITIERDGNITRIDTPATPDNIFLNIFGRPYCNVNLFDL